MNINLQMQLKIIQNLELYFIKLKKNKFIKINAINTKIHEFIFIIIYNKNIFFANSKILKT